MNPINVLYLKDASFLPTRLSTQLNSLERHRIGCAPWPSYPYKPEAYFVIAYTDDHIFLKYFVTEKTVRAATSQVNGKVWEDSCVEFFISFDDKGYYNLEFNCLGVARIGFGKDKHNRELVSKNVISALKFESSIHNTCSGLISWELAIAIPLHIFIHHSPSSLKGMECRANFYKCGDLLPQPHFVTWSPVCSEEPNFHLPQFFGTLRFH